MDRKKINKYVNIIFIIYLLVYATIIFIKEVKTGKFQFEEMTKANQFYAYFVMGVIYLVFILKAIVSNAIIVIFFIGIKLGLKMYKKESIYKENIKDVIIYYRDKLKGYSPVEFGYVLNYDIDLERDIVMTVLMLKIKHKIDIQNDRIIIIDESNDNLNNSESFIFEKIKNHSDVLSSNDEFNQAVIDDTINDELLTDKEQMRVKLIKQIIFLIVGYISLIIINNLLSVFFLNKTYNIEANPLLAIFVGSLSFISMLLTILTALYPIFAIIAAIIYYMKNKSFKYLRTKKGKELLNKVLGLKRFLKDFSNLENEQLECINIWDEYLVYSILFNYNQKVLQDCLFAIENNSSIF